jgi:outer membrane autotransporter protein
MRALIGVPTGRGKVRTEMMLSLFKTDALLRERGYDTELIFMAFAEPSLARNLIYEFLDPAGVSVNGTNIDLDQSKTSVEFGGGVNLVTGGQAVLYTLYLDGDYRLPVDSDGATILHGIAGFRTDW